MSCPAIRSAVRPKVAWSYRIGFDIAEADIDTMALKNLTVTAFFRARRNAGADQPATWRTLLPAVRDELFRSARLVDGARLCRVFFAPTEEAGDGAGCTRGGHGEVLKEAAALRRRPFSSICCVRLIASSSPSAVEHVPDDPGNEFLRLC
jgi:hypothetical protein